MRHPLVCWTLALACVVGFGSAARAQWGTLTGKFVYDGPAPDAKALKIDKDPECCKVKHNDESVLVGKDGGLANVVIYVISPKVKIHPDFEKSAKDQVEIDNKTCRFDPHIVPLRLTQTLLIKNSDTCSHNTNITPLGGGAINPLVLPGKTETHVFKKQSTLPIPVGCNIHPWMNAYVLPRDNPYFAVSGEDGTFKIENLPAEDLKFQVWQEKAGFVELKDWPKGKFNLKIKDGANDLGTIKLAPALFTKKK